MAILTYRKLDPSGEPLQGAGQTNFVSDLDAVAQMIATRLKLLQAEWWEDRSLGTPVFQSMLGHSGAGPQAEAISLLLQQRILTSPFVTGVSQVSAGLAGRAFWFTCQVQTQFGPLTVTNRRGPSAVLPD